MGHNLMQILIAIDQLVYCIIGTFLSIFNHKISVYADMTISAQAHRLAIKDYWYGHYLEAGINFLFRPWEFEHCKKAYESELSNSHLPPDMNSKE